MATDATGTPTSKGIPKFNTTNDAPSGLGFNAAMDAIDVLLDSYASKPAGIVSGEVPVWNGSAWVRSSVTRIGTGSLGSGTANSSTFLRGDGTWAAAGGAGFGTALPGSPVDGDQFILVDSTTAPTYSWLLRYVSAKASNKWVFIGGSPLKAAVATAETTTSTTYAALTTAGPSVTIPVAGDYVVDHGCFADNETASNMGHSYDIGVTGAVDEDSVRFYVAAAGSAALPAYRSKAKSLTAVALVSKYKTTAGTATFSERFLAVTPVAVGG